MIYNVFAFGTLKRGFPLHDQGLSTATFLGLYKTCRCYPMLIAGPWFAPMMFDEPNVGYRVQGELYKVDQATLANLDCLESVGKPGNFRIVVDVEPVEGGPSSEAFVFMKARHLAEPTHSQYLETYDDSRFVPFDGRQHQG